MDLSANIICQNSKFNCETGTGHITAKCKNIDRLMNFRLRPCSVVNNHFWSQGNATSCHRRRNNGPTVSVPGGSRAKRGKVDDIQSTKSRARYFM